MGNIRQKCPKCGNWVDGEYIQGTSNERTKQVLQTGAKTGISIAQHLDKLPDGFYGKLLKFGAQILVETVTSADSRSYYNCKCHQCGHTWKDYNTNSIKWPQQEVIFTIKSIIMDKLSVEEEEITNDANFQNDLGADSLDAVDIIMEFERIFEIEIPDDKAEQITTVGEAIEYISSRVC